MGTLYVVERLLRNTDGDGEFYTYMMFTNEDIAMKEFERLCRKKPRRSWRMVERREACMAHYDGIK